MDPIQSKTPDNFGYRRFGYDGGRDFNFSPRHLSLTSNANLVRNGTFLSWSQGTTGYPDAWEWNSVGALDRSADSAYWGTHGLRVTKIDSDGDVTRVYQDISYNPTVGELPDKAITISVWMKTNQGSECMRPFIKSGTSYRYGPNYSGGDEWQRIWMSQSFSSSPTSLQVGVEVEETAETSNVYYHIDCFMCVWGMYPAYYSEHHNDRSVICQDWDNDGTQTLIRGAQRVIPFRVEHTTTAGRLQTYSYTLDYGCDEIQSVQCNMYSTTVTNFYLILVNAGNYSTTGFDIYMYNASWAPFAASETIVIDGVIYCIGWDAPAEQWK